MTASVARAASTLLSNGHPVHVKLPMGDPVEDQEGLFIVHGSDGYSVFVPPGATELRIDFQTTPGTVVELLAQADVDVGLSPAFNQRAKWRATANAGGLATIIIRSDSGLPRLKSAIYFIGFVLDARDATEEEPFVSPEGELTATVSGPVIASEVKVQESRFNEGLDGWTRNDTASAIPGTNVGDPATTLTYQSDGGNPGGFARIRHTKFFGPDEWFLAPPKFLINLYALSGGRFEFDLSRPSGDHGQNFNVQLHVFNDDARYTWIGRPPPIPQDGWETFSATIDPQFWRHSAGNGTFEDVFSSPTRIEVRANYVVATGSTGLDNFRILSRGGAPPIKVLPLITSFAGGTDGWTGNDSIPGNNPLTSKGDEDSQFVWAAFEGNPGGYIRVAESGGEAPDAFVASWDFNGDMTDLLDPRFEFDYLHRSESGASSPVEIRLVGRDSIFTWTGVVPGDVWAHQIAPLTAESWTRTTGEDSFEDVLADVVSVEVSADQAGGPEANCMDNFALLTSDSPLIPQVITALPEALTFPGVATGANPGAQVLRVSSSGGSLHWTGSVSGELAGRVSLSQTSGDTPSTLSVSVDSQGLASGEYSALLTLTPTGTNIAPAVVTLRLVLGAAPFPTPIINEDGVVSAANFELLLSPGALGSIFGFSLANTEPGLAAEYGGRTGDRLPANLNGAKVLIYDLFGSLVGEAPLLYAGKSQINFQVPFEAFGLSGIRIVVEANGIPSNPVTVTLMPASPAMFTFDGTHAIAANQSGGINSSSSPAAAEALLTVYLSGQGVVAPAWRSGRAATSFPLIRAPGDTTVTIGGVRTVIQFLGLAPGMVGVAQLNIFVGVGTPSGEQEIIITISGVPSIPATVSIQ